MTLSGPIMEAVSALVDGKRSADEIARSLAARFRPEDVYYALVMMEQSRMIYDAAANCDGGDLFLWNYLGVDLPHAKAALDKIRVRVLVTKDLQPGPFVDAVRCFGLKVTEEDGDFTLVFARDYLAPELAEVNRSALQSGRPWMLAKPDGIVQRLGPIFHVGTTACWECLAHRLRGRRELENYIDASGASTPLASPVVLSRLETPVASHLAALHATKWAVLGDNPQLNGRVVTFDPFTLVTTSHIVTRRPQCPACGHPLEARRLPEPPLLDNQPRGFAVDNGHRGSSAEETFAKYQHHISPITGIVSELTPVRAPGDDLLKLHIASHNFAIDRSSLPLLKHSIETKSCGKGATDAQARTGALLEALERYSGMFQGDEPRIKATHREIGDRAIHPNGCMLYSERQYGQREEWNRLGSSFSFVPLPFDETAQIEWAPVWSLGLRTFRYLPVSYLYYGHGGDPASAFCCADSNGNAAGNSLEEAILQGFFEVVERDAVAMWWYNRVRLPGVNLESYQDPYIQRCRAFYRRNGREFWVLDVTNDFGIPTFAAVSGRLDQPLQEITLGFGAHFDARVAITRAIAEMNQFLPAVNGPVGSDGRRQYAYGDASAIRWWQTATVMNQPYLLPSTITGPRSATEYEPFESDDQLVDIMHCVLKAQTLGMDTLVLDQTRPDIGVRVAKVIVPGARHFWARLAPGRLYDVPVKLGWVSRPLREEELNPIPMFL
jgi:oxazoline/thiazoline synthase